MLLTKEVEIKVGNQLKYYENLGYEIPKHKDSNGKMCAKKGTKIKVKVKDLTGNSHAKVDVLCDKCNKNIVSKEYRRYLKQHNINGLDTCNECRIKNINNNFFNKYGVKSPSQLNEIKDKIKQTNLSKYGVDAYVRTDEFKERYKKTCLEKYGVEYTLQVPEIREKIIKTNLEKYGVTSYLFTKEFKLKTSGENASNWKGGVTSENDKIRHSIKYKEWREAVFKRDNYTCQCCGDNKGHNLQAHHKYDFAEYPDLRFDINNGITLCDKCHNPNVIGSFHHTYGTKNNTPEQLKEYIQYIQNKNNNPPLDNQEVI